MTIDLPCVPTQVIVESASYYLTLSNTKWGTDLGMLVVLFDQTFHLLH